ncbi:MAG: hypothetical protein P0S96_02765 [Simkaniaceae bacterium]|nr:hypothetical protein [Candidatus Sacchlamyda saccharinae]
MASTEISRKQKWETAHDILDIALEKEIHSMREVLASLHQEELALLEGNEKAFIRIMRQRSSLVVGLIKERTDRMEATALLTKCCVLLGKTEMLPHSDELSCQILTKLDQIVALLERTNLQNCRNEALFHQKRETKNEPLLCKYPHPLHRVRRKMRVATYSQKD